MKRLLALAFLGAATAAWGQAPPPRPTPTPQPQAIAPITESVSVDITNIEVVVTDSKGNRVTGLTGNDFEVRQDGVPQPITNFYAVDGQRVTFLDGKTLSLDSKEAEKEAPREIKARYILYIDNLNIQPQNRNRMFKRLKEFVQQTVGSRAEAQVIAYNRSLKIRQKFTSEAGLVVGVLEDIERETGGGTPQASERKDAIQRINDSRSSDDALRIARTYSDSLRNDLEFDVEAIKNTLNGLAGLEGRKVFVYVSEGLPEEAGAELYDTVQRKFGASGSTLLQFEYNMNGRYASIVQAANAQGVTIWALDASGLATDSFISAEHQYMETRPSDFLLRQNMQGPLQFLAEQTGGMAAINTNDWKASLDELARDFTSFYSLGYRSARSAGDRPHSVDVTVKRKGLRVRFRKGLLEKSPETRIAETVLSALDYPRDDNPLNMTVRLDQSLPYERDTYLLPLHIVLPIGKLGLIPAGDHYEANYLIYLIIRDSSGDKSDLQVRRETIRVPEKELKIAQGKDQPYELKMVVRDGAQRLSLAVRDATTNVTSYYQKNFFVSSLPPAKKS